MRKDLSWTVLHDISTYMGTSRSSLACRYLFGHVVSDEKICPASDYEGLPANIGAFKISDVTMKYADNLFQSLFIPWKYEPSARDLDDIKKIIKKYYSDKQYNTFCESLSFQDFLFAHPVYENISVSRAFVRKYFPKLYKWLRDKKRTHNKSR